MSYAVGSLGGRVKLKQNADNWAPLDLLVDTDPHVTLPPGDWWISRGLNVSGTLQGHGPSRTTLRQLATPHASPTIGVGGDGRWPGSEGHVAVDGVKILGLAIVQQDVGAVDNHCIFVNDGCNDITIGNVRVQGSAYEGIVIGAQCDTAHMHDIEAYDCGVGYEPVDYRARAGINPLGKNTILEDFIIRGCGQGVELGYRDNIVRRGLITEPQAAFPLYGVNIGSHVYGCYNIVVQNVKVDGFENSVSVGNVNGRLARVEFSDCEFDGDISFYGGLHDNLVVLPDAGPDTYGSFFERCTFRLTEPSYGIFTYYGGNVDNDGLYGREPLILRGNKFYSAAMSPLNTAPTIGFAGEVTATVLVEQNRFYGLDVAPGRGDVQSYSLGTNIAVPGLPNLAVRDNQAFTTTGAHRLVVLNIE